MLVAVVVVAGNVDMGTMSNAAAICEPVLISKTGHAFSKNHENSHPGPADVPGYLHSSQAGLMACSDTRPDL
jgi:hypothetical protein